jgi:hypothetical protein
MNKKIAGIMILILIVIGLGISVVPGMVNNADRQIGKQDSQPKETMAAQQNNVGDISKGEEKEPVKPSDSQPEVQTEQPVEEIRKETDHKSQTVVAQNNQVNSSTPPDSPTVNSHKNSNVNQSGSGVNPSGSSTSASNTSSNQASRGGSAEESKYPLLSKVNGSFGQFRYKNLSDGRIEVDPQWVAANIVTITLPGLNRQVQVHKEAADNFITAFNYIKNGTAVVNGKEVSLLSLIKTMDGTYVTRHVYWDPSRGLSNHSWGTAIDINATGHFGYVDPEKDPDDPNLILWEKAFKPAGFSWGNRYSDSMHYELIK